MKSFLTLGAACCLLLTANPLLPNSKKKAIYKKIENKFPYGKQLIKISFEEGIDPQLTAAIILHESKGKVFAKGSSGEVGLMQIMQYHLTKQEIKTAYDPSFNIRKGLKIFKMCLKIEGVYRNDEQVLRALSCYNAGPNRKNKVITNYENAVVAQYIALGE